MSPDLTCPICSRDLPDGAVRCPACGASLIPSDTVTRVGASSVGGVHDVHGFGDARFPPGRIFAGRYRIVSLLGRGGMGEVYRADDLKLGQRVALKLLSVSPEREPEFLQRFIAEVRHARAIAHPNVCRVYDIGEAEGWHYLSMEYVDGETLASLIRRIGGLPTEKALDVARQLCAGLAAAHERRVLHRDLKPANIMLDGRGQVRIVDLGLATPVGDTRDDVAGTPAYMAPEQLTGSPVTERTDLYALGLVLYEMFTGETLLPYRTFEERAFAGLSPAVRLARMPGVDSGVQKTIRQCLESDPADRPSSAWAVAAVLPGGDPLAAALAQGRMPSPEMIAAAPQTGAVRPAVAWSALAAIVMGTLAVAWTVSSVTQVEPSRVPKPPEVLAERARNLLASVGHGSPVRDSEYWFEPDRAGARSPAVQSFAPIRFVYRQSPEYLVTQNSVHAVIETDPPNDVPGIATVIVDPSGGLLKLAAVGGGVVRPPGRKPPLDWPALFDEAGLDPRDFLPVTEFPVPTVPHDLRIGWEGTPAGSSQRLRVVGAAMSQRPVFFEVSSPLMPAPERQTWFSRGARSRSNEVLLVIFSIALFAGGGLLARRNLLRGYGDTRGALRLSVVIAVGGVFWAVLRAHHVPLAVEEWVFLLMVAGWSLVWAGFAWLMYISLEPYARKWWPNTLVSWARLLAGRARDPLVGRDILAGLAGGVLFVLLLVARVFVMRRTGFSPPPLDQAYVLEALRPIRFVGLATYFALDTLTFTLGALGMLLLLRVALRSARAAAIGWTLIVGSLQLIGGMFVWDSAFALALASLSITMLLRFGIVSTAVMLLFVDLTTRLPVTLEPGAWYIGSSAATLALIGALAAFGFAVASTGRRIARA